MNWQALRSWLTPQVIRKFLVLLLFLVFLQFLYGIREPLTPFLISWLLAYTLNPLVEKLVRWGWNRSLAILFVFSMVFTAFGLLLVYGVPIIFVELLRLGEELPQQGIRFHSFLMEVQDRMYRSGLPEAIREVLFDVVRRVESLLIDLIRNLAQGLLRFVSHIFDIVLIPVMTFYFLRDWRQFGISMLQIVPTRYRHEITYVAASLDRVLKGFLQGHLLVAALVGALTALGMALIGLDYALLIGFIAGLADLIPYFGPLIGALPAVGLGLLESPQQAIYAFLVMAVVQQIESNLISPKIIGDRVGLHPLGILLSLAVGGHFFGILGLLLAVPVTAVLRVLAQYVYLKLLNPDR